MKLMQTGRIFWQISPLLIFMFLPALAFGFWSALAATLLALLLHELAHVLAGKLLKVNTFKIELMPFGGVSLMESCKPWKMALIAMTGPLCNALIVLCFLPLVKYNPYEWLCVFLQANLVIAIFNLMPAFPLDGGRVLVCMLSPVLGQTFAERICSI
ncbi:MAG: M50 family metallopeptidase, partial [Christensenellales bacterium]